MFKINFPLSYITAANLELYLCPFVTKAGVVLPFVKLIVGRFFTLFYKQLILRL